MVKASELVARETLLSFVPDAGGCTALTVSLKDGADTFAYLLNCDGRCYFFSHDGLR